MLFHYLLIYSNKIKFFTAYSVFIVYKKLCKNKNYIFGKEQDDFFISKFRKNCLINFI